MKDSPKKKGQKREIRMQGVSASQDRRLRIVGLGASAGGLDALEEFFSAMPPDCGMAFVVVTHQHPGQASLLPELLKRRTSMAVLEVRDRVRIKPNTIFVSSPDGWLTLR